MCCAVLCLLFDVCNGLCVVSCLMVDGGCCLSCVVVYCVMFVVCGSSCVVCRGLIVLRRVSLAVCCSLYGNCCVCCLLSAVALCVVCYVLIGLR